MWESKDKNKKNYADDYSTPLQTELEMIALKAKNLELTKAHTKLIQENSELKSQIYALQAELIETQSKHNSVETTLKNLERSMEKCTPNLIEILDLFLKVPSSKQIDPNGSNNIIQTPERGVTSRNKVITHTVKPHTVNGTVLNLVPTISLTRLNTNNTSDQLPDDANTSHNTDSHNSLPSTSNAEDSNEIPSPTVDTTEDGPSFISRRTRSSKLGSEHRPIDFDDIESEEESSDESQPENEEENMQRLSTIQEESIQSINRSRTSFGEVRIYLSRLSNEDLRDRSSQNTSFYSMYTNSNDTCLNIETTVVENAENQVSKTLRTDIMVFSPHTNSTRMENNASRLNNLSPLNDERKINVLPGSTIQSTEATPSTSIVNGDSELATNDVSWLPTPSMSAIGDIDHSTSKLEILKQSDVKNVPRDNTTPQRYTRSASRSKSRNHSNSRETLYINSIEDQNGDKSIRTFVNGHRGASDERPLTPIIVLDRLENIVPERVSTPQSLNIKIMAGTDEPKENETPSQNSKKNRSKSMKRGRSRKRKLTEEGKKDSLQDKIREIQIRLSNYIPPSAESPKNKKESGDPSNTRPLRAARPKDLKDASLKAKLRRMF